MFFHGSGCHADKMLALWETVRKRFDKLKNINKVSHSRQAAQADLDRW